MSQDYDALIYSRHIELEVVVPEKYVWEFMNEFGQVFEYHDTVEGSWHVRPVERYFSHPNGWHVIVRIREGFNEKRFDLFFRDFCESRSLKIKDK
jgi:hypothetical protein